MIVIEKCPSCGSYKIRKLRRNWVGKHNGLDYVVPDLQYYECPDCGERVYDRDAMRRIEEIGRASCRERVYVLV